MDMKQKNAELTYMAYFTVVSMLLTPLLHLPLMVSFFAPIFSFEFLGQELMFLALVTFVPLVVLYVVYRLAKAVKSEVIFFLITFLVLTGVSYFNFTIRSALSDPANAWRLLVLGIALGLYTSGVLTYFWKRIVLLKNQAEVKFLKPLLILVAGILVVEWMIMITTGENLLLEVYIAVGNFIKPLVNIFYLDFYGFVGLFLSLIASLVASVKVFIKGKARQSLIPS